MKTGPTNRLQRLNAVLRQAPGVMLAGPVATLLAYWSGGETGLLLAALAITALAVAMSTQNRRDRTSTREDEFISRQSFLIQLEQALIDTRTDKLDLGVIVLQFDDVKTLLDRHGRAAQTETISRIGDRIVMALRKVDQIMRLEGGGFAITIAPTHRLTATAVEQMIERLQGIISEPVTIGGSRIYLTCSAGYCVMGRAGAAGAAGLLDAAQIAADEALLHGPNAYRSYAPGMARRFADLEARRRELEIALDQGQIVAWFQPQISADTGEITGFEALARWQHPARGLVSPADFITDIDTLGLSERLSEVMTQSALSALIAWDAAGCAVPAIAVNFSEAELRNPQMADKLKWELDRFELSPDRLVIEVLETVMTKSDSDIIVRNVAELARVGCRIDMDDFGTGHSSMTNVRRLTVHRLKIDRSFAARVDQDVNQQRMVAAILSMAERLGLDTLAEGVETGAELAILLQLGCGHVQGFGIARPMPLEATMDWIAQHRTRPPMAWHASNTTL